MYKHRLFLVLALCHCLLVYWHIESFFFWDTVQFAGKHGSWFYDNGLLSSLPESLDSGHPPIFGMYQAALWTIFGQHLWVSHLSMLPFLLMVSWLTIKLAQLHDTEGQNNYWLFPIVVFLCPLWLGHSILVSPDIVLVAGFMMTLYGLLDFKKNYIIIGSLILALISTRGMLILAGLALYHMIVLHDKGEKLKPLLTKIFKIYFPAVAVILLYQSWHLMTTNWIGFHEDSPWSASFDRVSPQGLLRNCAVFGWRLLDYGLFIPIIIACFQLRTILTDKFQLWKLWIILTGIMFLVIIPFNGLLNHRYLLPIQLLMLFMVCRSINHLTPSIKKTLTIILLISSMVLGNFVIYPDKIAQGWESTAAHWPFYSLVEEMDSYIDSRPELTKDMIGTAFPLRVPTRLLKLNGDNTGYHQHDLQTDNYILISNVMNEFSDEEIDILKEWQVVKEIESFGVYVRLVKRNPTTK